MTYYEIKLKIGSLHGNFKVISEPFRKNKIWYVKCECACGKIRELRAWQLNNSKMKSCGCSENNGRFIYKGVGDLSLSYYNSFKQKRRKKGIDFSDNLTIEYLWNLFLEQERKCKLSGLNIYLDRKWSGRKNRIDKSISQTASIDRIDNSKGYTIDNVRWVHKDLNYMKGGMKDEDFVFLCNKVLSVNKLDISKVDLERFNSKRLYFKDR